jgi:E3 ubiquitin-protein ligase RNF213
VGLVLEKLNCIFKKIKTRLEMFAILLNNQDNKSIYPKKLEIIIDFFENYIKKIMHQNLNSIKENLEKYKKTSNFDDLKSILKEILNDFFEKKDFNEVNKFMQEIIDYFNENLFNKYPTIEKGPIFEKIYEINNESLKIDIFFEIFKEIDNCKSNIIYYRLMMHSGFTIKDLKTKIEIIKNKHLQIKKKYPELKTIIFIDELNTSSYLGYLKEIFIDHTSDGKELPDSIFFIGAINPVDTVDSENKNEKNIDMNYQKVKNDKKQNSQEFIVNVMPKSLDNIKTIFCKLSKLQTKEFIESLFSSQYYQLFSEISKTKNNNFKKIFCNLIIFCQEYISDLKMDRIHLSIRDIIRTVKIFMFLSEEKNQNYLISSKIKEEKLKKYSIKDLPDYYIRLIITISVVYWFRLPTVDEIREKFYRSFQKTLNHELKVNNDIDLINCKIDLKEICNNQLEYFFYFVKNNGHIPNNIAKTQALMENIFCNFICIQSSTPFFIVGPPGTSKTLSYNITSKIEASDKNTFFQNAKNIQGVNII